MIYQKTTTLNNNKDKRNDDHYQEDNHKQRMTITETRRISKTIKRQDKDNKDQYKDNQ